MKKLFLLLALSLFSIQGFAAGWLDESRILNGSLFHNCARVKEFQDNDPKIQYLKDNCFKIEKHNGAYRFNTSMTKSDVVKNLYANPNDEAMAQKYRIENSFNGVEKGFENDSDNEAKQCNFQAIYEDYRGWANGDNFEESYLYIVDNNGNCIDGRASSQNVALKECQKRKAKKFIKNSECKVYAIGDEIVWDGYSKPSKDENKENASSKKYPTVDYNTNLLEICKRDVEVNMKSYYCVDGSFNKVDKAPIISSSILVNKLKSMNKILRGKKPIYSTNGGTQIKIEPLDEEKSIILNKLF